MSEELEPCPFCGQKDVKVSGRLYGRHSVYQVVCSCGAEGRGSSNSAGDHIAWAEASKYWNTRAAPAAQAVGKDSERRKQAFGKWYAANPYGELTNATVAWMAYHEGARMERAALAAPVQPACKTCCDQGEVFVRKGDVEPWMDSEPDPVMAACPDCAAPVLPACPICNDTGRLREPGCDEGDCSACLERAAPVQSKQQPVARVVSKHGDPEAFGEREIELLGDLSKIPYGTPVYLAAPEHPRLARAIRLLRTCEEGGYRDVDGDWVKRQVYDAKGIAAFLAEVDLGTGPR